MGTVTLKHDVTNESVADPSVDIMNAGMVDDNPNTNSGSALQLVAGKSSCSGKGCVEQENLHYYDMAQVVPKSAIITAAEWWIYVLGYAIDMGDDGIVRFYAQRIRRNGVRGNTVWVGSEATYNNYANGSPWTIAGAKNPNNDRDTGVSLELSGLAIGDYGFGGATTTTDTSLTDTTKAWAVNEWVGLTTQCNNKTMLITSNTATTLTGLGWSGGGNPGDGNVYIISSIGWWSPSVLTIVQDAQDNWEGKVHFVFGRLDFINVSGWVQYHTKDTASSSLRPHLRVTYTLDSKTYQAVLL